MYLKTIYLLKQENHEDPRPLAIAQELDIAKGSVSEMLHKLAQEGLIQHESYGKVLLTKKGSAQAQKVLGKYEIIRDFLSNILKVNPKKVHEEACNLEHAFSDESIERLKKLLKS